MKEIYSVTKVYFMCLFTVMQKINYFAEGKGSALEGTLELMLLGTLPMVLLCMLLQTIASGVCFVTLSALVWHPHSEHNIVISVI